MTEQRPLNEIKEDPLVRTQFFTLFRELLQGGGSGEPRADWRWEDIFALARSHQIFPLILEQAARSPGCTERPAFQQELLEAMSQVSGQTIRTEALLSLYRALDRAGLHPLVVKGLVCRQLYGDYGAHRTSGDEDLYIPKDLFFSTQKVLEQEGFVLEDRPPTEADLETVHEVSYKQQESGLLIELHIHLIGTLNPFYRKMDRYFIRCFEEYRELQVEGTTLRTMTPTDHFLYLLCHMLKHFTCGGFGVRQLSDLLQLERQQGGELDWVYLDRALEELGARGFYADLHAVGSRYLGYELPQRYETVCPEAMLEDMMNSGAFGIDEQRNLTAQQFTSLLVHTEDRRLSTRVKGIWKQLLPSREFLLARDPTLETRSWSLWEERARRWKKFARTMLRGEKNLPLESAKVGRRRVELLKQYQFL